jgi:acylphosphatase
VTTRTVHVRIEGCVQGVGFRAFVERHALAAGVDGWVRNRRDGAVEVVLHGPDSVVAELLRRCEEGPPSSIVESVEVIGEGVGAFSGFEVRPTA